MIVLGVGVRSVDKKPDVDIGDKAKSIKDRFEKGEIYNNDENESNHNHKHQDEDVFEQGTNSPRVTDF